MFGGLSSESLVATMNCPTEPSSLAIHRASGRLFFMARGLHRVDDMSTASAWTYTTLLNTGDFITQFAFSSTDDTVVFGTNFYAVRARRACAVRSDAMLAASLFCARG